MNLFSGGRNSWRKGSHSWRQRGGLTDLPRSLLTLVLDTVYPWPGLILLSLYPCGPILMMVLVRQSHHAACPLCRQEARRSLSLSFFFFILIFWENLAETFFFFFFFEREREKIKSKGCGKITFCVLRYQNRPFVRTKRLLKCEKFLEGIF